jgi:hypothetical protein
MKEFLIRLAIVLAILLAFMAAGAVLMHNHDRKHYEPIIKAHEAYRAGQLALAENAKRANAVIALDNMKRKERADEESDRRTGIHNGVVAGLRRELDQRNAGGSALPPVSADAKSPGDATFDRAELERALRDRRAAIRRLVDEGSQAVIDLDVAKLWAHP